MTSIKKISNNENIKSKPILTPKNTGYAAAGALAVATVRAFSKSKNITKSHKIFGYIAAAFTAIHIGIIEYLHHKYKKM